MEQPRPRVVLCHLWPIAVLILIGYIAANEAVRNWHDMECHWLNPRAQGSLLSLMSWWGLPHRHYSQSVTIVEPGNHGPDFSDINWASENFGNDGFKDGCWGQGDMLNHRLKTWIAFLRATTSLRIKWSLLSRSGETMAYVCNQLQQRNVLWLRYTAKSTWELYPLDRPPKTIQVPTTNPIPQLTNVSLQRYRSTVTTIPHGRIG